MGDRGADLYGLRQGTLFPSGRAAEDGGHLHPQIRSALLSRPMPAYPPTVMEFGTSQSVQTWAMLSRCGRYRYALSRAWNPAGGLVNWIMLNPSTADGRDDDPTIRRCMGFARAWGYGGIVVTNLFGLRTPDPRILDLDTAPEGSGNDASLFTFAHAASLHVAAWGTNKAGGAKARAHYVRTRILAAYLLQCLAKTKDGSPMHPLYVTADKTPIPLENT